MYDFPKQKVNALEKQIENRKNKNKTIPGRGMGGIRNCSSFSLPEAMLITVSDDDQTVLVTVPLLSLTLATCDRGARAAGGAAENNTKALAEIKTKIKSLNVPPFVDRFSP